MTYMRFSYCVLGIMSMTIFFTLVSFVLCTPVYASDSKIVAIAQGPMSSIAIGENGSMWYWGSSGSGESGDAYKVTENASSVTPFKSFPVIVGNISGVKNAATGTYFCIALLKNGTVWTWGWNGLGQLGRGGTANFTPNDIGGPVPGIVPDLVNVTMISAGGEFCVALTDNGIVWTWGNNNYGQLGNGTNIIGIGGEVFHGRSSPDTVKNLDNVVYVSAGPKNVMAIRNDGTVWVWGSIGLSIANEYGQKNSQSLRYYQGISVPIHVDGIDHANEVKVGESYAIVLKEDGTVWVLGGSHITPAIVSGLANITHIVMGDRHCVALREDGSVWAWGDNSKGQLGDGTTTGRDTPVEVPIDHIIAIAASGFNSMALDENGTVWTWGNGDYGELGNGKDSGAGNATHQPDNVYRTIPGKVSFENQNIREDNTIVISQNTRSPEAKATPGFDTLTLVGTIIVITMSYSNRRKKKG